MTLAAQPGNSKQQRGLLGSTAMQASTKQQVRSAGHKTVRTAQLGGEDGLPPFVGVDVPRGPRAAQPQQFGGPGGGFNGGGFNGGGFNGGGGRGANWYGIAGVTANAVDLAADVGISLAAPIVNGVASNIPLMVPAGPNGCIRGEPRFLPRFGVVMCVVGNGAAVTNYMFNAANVLVDAAARGVGLAAQIAAVATRNSGK